MVEGSAQEVRRVAADVWSALGTSGPPDGWQLPVAAAHVEDLAASTGLARDDDSCATHICWTGCPECVDRGDLVMGEPMARNYIDKLLLDTWFMDGIARSQEAPIRGSSADEPWVVNAELWGTPRGRFGFAGRN